MCSRYVLILILSLCLTAQAKPKEVKFTLISRADFTKQMFMFHFQSPFQYFRHEFSLGFHIVSDFSHFFLLNFLTFEASNLEKMLEKVMAAADGGKFATGGKTPFTKYDNSSMLYCKNIIY